MLVVFVAVSVTNSFYRIRLLALSLTPMPEGPWDCLSVHIWVFFFFLTLNFIVFVEYL